MCGVVGSFLLPTSPSTSQSPIAPLPSPAITILHTNYSFIRPSVSIERKEWLSVRLQSGWTKRDTWPCVANGSKVLTFIQSWRREGRRKICWQLSIQRCGRTSVWKLSIRLFWWAHLGFLSKNCVYLLNTLCIPYENIHRKGLARKQLGMRLSVS